MLDVPLKKMRRAVEGLAENLFQLKSPQQAAHHSPGAAEGVPEENEEKNRQAATDGGFSTPAKGHLSLDVASGHNNDVTDLMEKIAATPKRRKGSSRLSGNVVPHGADYVAISITSASASGEALKTPKSQSPTEAFADAPRGRRGGRRSTFFEEVLEEVSKGKTGSTPDTPKHAPESFSLADNQSVLLGSTPVRNGRECYKEQQERRAEL